MQFVVTLVLDNHSEALIWDGNLFFRSHKDEKKIGLSTAAFWEFGKGEKFNTLVLMVTLLSKWVLAETVVECYGYSVKFQFGLS